MSRPSERDVIGAIQAAKKGDVAKALAVAEARIRENPADWRGWYLRFLANLVHPLPLATWQPLDALSERDRDLLYGLRRYVTGPKAERLGLARELAIVWPDSGLARTLLAAALLGERRFDEARREAAAALELDPTNFLAARTLVRAAEHGGASEDDTVFCRLLRSLPYDPEVVRTALKRCPFDDDPGTRFETLRPVLLEQRGTWFVPQTLRKIGGSDGFRDIPDSLWPRLIEALDPEDPSWLGDASDLARAVAEHPTVLRLPSVAAFLGRLLDQTRHVDLVLRPQILEWVPFALARSLDAAGHPDKALTVIQTALGQVVPLRSLALRRDLAALFRKLGDDEAAAGAERDVRLLSDPEAAFSGTQEDFRRIEELLTRLDKRVVQDRDGKEIALPLGDGAQVLFFWSGTCWFSKQQAREVQEARRTQRAGGWPQIVWVNRDKEEFAQERDAFMAEFGLGRDHCYRTSLEREDLDDVLGIYGTPWMVLVLPDGHVALEARGAVGVSWLDRAAAVAAAHQAAVQKWRPGP